MNANNFASEINSILSEYAVVVTEDMKAAIKKVAKEGAKEVANNASVFGGTGKYKKGWKSKFENGRVTAQGIIYNANVPGLPHLLEHGHAKRGGGRVGGTVHIAPVADSLEEKLINELEGSL